MRRNGSACLLLALSLPGLLGLTQTAQSPLWGDLKPGRYRVGYRVIFRVDPTILAHGFSDTIGVVLIYRGLVPELRG